MKNFQVQNVKFGCVVFISLGSQETSSDMATFVQKDMYDWEYVDLALVAVQAFAVHLFTSTIFQSLDHFVFSTIKDERWVLCEMYDIDTCQVPNLSSLSSEIVYKIVSSILQFFLKTKDVMHMFSRSKFYLSSFKFTMFYVVSCIVLSTRPKCWQPSPTCLYLFIWIQISYKAYFSQSSFIFRHANL